MKKIIFGMVLLTVSGFAQVNKMPAARVHVKMVNGVAVKFTSKLANLVDLNFTMGNGHQDGKKVITAALDRIAQEYGNNGVDAFKVKHFASSADGSNKYEIPNFTLDDLLAGDVIVGDNISAFGDAAMGVAKQQAIQQAIEVEGKGYLGFHGSGDNTTNTWSWYTNTLHPMNYGGHGNRTVGPVYKHLDEAAHIIMQDVLSTKTTSAKVPNEIDNGGNEVFADNVPTRLMKNEWYQFGRDISRDPAYKDNVTILLKYDANAGTVDLPAQNKRKGGNLYTYLYKIGKGITSYIPAGHENDELLDPTTGFDGGAGDFDRYIAQTLFFQAGYKSGVCDASCNGLPIVDAKNHLTGQTVGSTATHQFIALKKDLFFEPNKVAFSIPSKAKWEARVTDMSGHQLFSKSGRGQVYYDFDGTGFKTGVYFLSVKIGNAKPQIHRYAFL